MDKKLSSKLNLALIVAIISSFIPFLGFIVAIIIYLSSNTLKKEISNYTKAIKSAEDELRLIKSNLDNEYIYINKLKFIGQIKAKAIIDAATIEAENILACIDNKIQEKIKYTEEVDKLTDDKIKFLDLKQELIHLQEDITNKQDIINNLGIEIFDKNNLIDDLNNIIAENNEIISKKAMLSKLCKDIDEKRTELNDLDIIENYQSFGLYTPKYNLMDSNTYKNKLIDIRNLQKNMVKCKSAVDYFDGWTLDGDSRKGTAMNNDNIKLILRSFNNECDANIIKVKFNNIENIRKRILKAFELLNKLGERMKISIKREYLNLKLQELEIAYEYELKRQEEKEEQQRIREQMREEAKALKEIENAKKKLEKEESHFKNAIKDIENQLLKCSDSDKVKLLNNLDKLNSELSKLEKEKENIENREKNTRAGYVYIISNIGSFGEGVYKIGMTRRLEPNDRVKELGDASVPFQFDVHAMIFSDDAPSLENALHKRFSHNSVNKINMRKEFFKVSLDEIEHEVNKNYNEVVEFTKIAEASEYRESLLLENNEIQKKACS